MADPTQRYATPALEKGLDVLELLAHQPEGLTKSQIARALQRSVSEIFRVLVSLERRGYIAHVSEDRYSLTLKLFQLAREHPPTERLVAAAIPVMNRLAHESAQSCHLAVLEADRVVILAQTNAPANLGFYVKVGSTVNLMEAASGYVVLAHLSDAERARAVAAWTSETRRKLPPGFEAHLASIRRRGYEQQASYVVKGVTNISVPIIEERDSAVAALTMPYIQYMKPAVSLAQVTGLLRGAAAEISRALGGERS